MPALHYAIKIGDIDAVRLFISMGADINSRELGGIWNFTALASAVFYNQLEIAKLLIELGADVNLPITMIAYSNVPKFNALYYAAKQGNSYIVNLLLENGADFGVFYGNGYGTSLHVASKEGTYEAVIALVTAGVNVNVMPPKTQSQSLWIDGTLLDYAANNLTYKNNPKNLDLVKFLVEHGGTRTMGNNISCPVISGYWGLRCNGTVHALKRYKIVIKN